MSSRVRKYDSGCEKRKKKKRIEEIIKSQRGSLDKFVTKESQSSRDNQHVDAFDENPNLENLVGNQNDSNDDINVDDPTNVNANASNDVLDDNNVDVNASNDVLDDTNIDDATNVDANASNDVLNDTNVNANASNDVLDDTNVDHVANVNDTFNNIDIFDPRNWDFLDCKMIDVLVAKGPKRDLYVKKGPKDKFSKRFSATWYTRILSNGEKCDRDWLVYSVELDKVFCFCCKIFKKKHGKGQLTNDGFGDWSHLSTRLKEHETSIDHVMNMKTWYDFRLRLQKNQTIDKVAQNQIEKEKSHWKKVLVRIVAIVKFLAKHNLAFRGTNLRLYEKSNGNFLGLIEMLAEFDPTIQDHVQRITNDDMHFHYLGNRIQNELIDLLARRIKSEIIKKVKEAKYFSVILNCTPDISHQEQMSLILRYVDVSSKTVSIEESFLGFLEVNDTTGQGLFDVSQDELKCLGLDIDDVRGQGYDNGSNMKGKHQGVQKKLLDINPRAFYTSCASHSLNLTLCDIANTCGKATDFFGIIQCIYTIFANSTKRWQVFKDNVK
ncbi:hypothetical protein L6452_24285 [Arctium lappa]|uniref:Uncharacterized protein n=1 Tax=Arctium lappa TaxID=4217 RepID=A0ACB9A8I7_ARCLA|nr:hypothetical protein L6452_24285 [Arctium lappa]